ncbi:MAG: hypothetical protein V4596_14510 [Bdellovibrionota bacterium]
MENKQSNQFNSNPYTNTDKFNKKDVKDDSISHKVGDSIERLGEKVIKAGAEKLGKAIYNAGDKIEHMKDNKKNSFNR